jgi:hypothetical protein
VLALSLLLLFFTATTFDSVVAFATGLFGVLAYWFVIAFLAIDGTICTYWLCCVAFDLQGCGVSELP